MSDSTQWIWYRGASFCKNMIFESRTKLDFIYQLVMKLFVHSRRNLCVVIQSGSFNLLPSLCIWVAPPWCLVKYIFYLFFSLEKHLIRNKIKKVSWNLEKLLAKFCHWLIIGAISLVGGDCVIFQGGMTLDLQLQTVI